MLSWLENTDVCQWVAQSDWGYPILLALHSAGMGIVVGLMILLDIRVLGYAKSISLDAFEKLMTLAWIGFAINLVSGVLLFGSRASHMISNWALLAKLACIVVGGVIAWSLWRALRTFTSEQNSVDVGTKVATHEFIVTPTARKLAIASLTTWFVAIFFGRLIASVLDAQMMAGRGLD